MGNKSVKKNYFYNVAYQILLLITPLITSPYISRVLGADQIGRYSYVNSIVSYFVLLATLGITTYGRREISYVQNEIDARSRVFWNTKSLQICTSGIVSIFYLVYALCHEEMLFYLVFVFNILAVAADVTWFFQGIEEFGKIVIRNIFFKLLGILYIFIAVRDRDDLIRYVFGLAFFLFISNGSLWFYLPKYINKPEWHSLRPFKDIRTVFSLFIPTIAIEVYTVLDKTMIGVITKNPFENGYYEQAVKISKMALTIVTALAPVMIPRIGYYFHRSETNQLCKIMYRGYNFVWFLGIPLCFGLIGISFNFVPWFLGPGFEKVSLLLCVLSFLILAIGINNLTGIQYLIPTKRQNLFTFTVLIGAAINFIINIFLIRKMASIGAAIASVAAESVIALIQLYLIRKEISVKKVFLESIHYWIAGMIMLALLFWENCYLTPSVLHTCIMIVSGGITYLLVLFFMRDKFLLSNVKSVWEQIWRGKRE